MITRAFESRRFRRVPIARPTAYTVASSRGYSPATPRMPSVPNSWRTCSFIAGVGKSRCSWFSWMLFGNDGYVDRNGFRDAHERIGDIGIGGERCAADHAGCVDRVCNGAFNAVHALI